MKLSKTCPRYRDFGALYPSSTKLRKALCDYYAMIVRLCIYTVEFSQKSSMLHKMFSEIWRGLIAISKGYRQITTAILNSFEAGFGPFEKELSQLAQQIQDVVSLISKQAAQHERDLQTKEREDARAHRKFLVKFGESAQREFESRREFQLQTSHRRAEKHRQRILKATSAFNHMSKYNQLRHECMPHTSIWILDNVQMKNWTDGSLTSLCLSGK